MPGTEDLEVEAGLEIGVSGPEVIGALIDQDRMGGKTVHLGTSQDPKEGIVVHPSMEDQSHSGDVTD